MATITAHPPKEHPRGNQRRPKPKPPPVPPPVTINPKFESLDRRIRNLEALGNGVFIGNVLASYMALPGLVGFWPMSSVQRSTGNAYDLSGQGRTLTYNGNPAYTYYNGLVPYIDLDGTGDFLSRADETDLDITGAETIYTTGAAGLTMGGWFWFDTTGTQVVMNKWNATGNQQSFLLYKTGGEVFEWVISSTGANTFTVNGGIQLTASTWFFATVRFTPSTEIAVFTNSTKVTNTTSIPASLFSSTTSFIIGARGDTTLPMNGRASLCFLCANALGDDLVSSLFQASRVLFEV